MGRSKIWHNPETKSVIAEDEVWEFFSSITKIQPGKALEEWMRAQIPKDQSAVDYRLQKIEEEKDILTREYQVRIDRLREEMNEKVQELESEKRMIFKRKTDELKNARDRWQELKSVKTWKAPNPSWRGDGDIIEGLKEHGFFITYGQVLELWEELEGPLE